MTGAATGRQHGLLDVMAELTSEEFRDDPYPLYARLRSEAPLLNVDGRWLVSRHHDCEAVLRSRAWERMEELMCLPDAAVCPTRAPQHELSAAAAGTTDPFVLDEGVAPERQRLREIFASVFSAATVRRLLPRIRAVTDDLLARARAQGTVDFVDAVALPLPTIVVCDLLGVPYADRNRFEAWTSEIVRSADPLFTMTTREVQGQRRAGEEFGAYFRELIRQRRASPRDDLLSTLAADPRGLDDGELVAACIMLLVAGHEMTANFLGLAAWALARHPEQLALLRADPGLAPAAVEELLRFDSPAQITPRVAVADTQLSGTRVRRGEVAVLLLGSANRDPEVFAEPDRLLLDRPYNGHLAFGHGHLYCPGAPLARAQARLAVAALAGTTGRLDLAGRPRRKATFCIRGLESLPVRLG